MKFQNLKLSAEFLEFTNFKNSNEKISKGAKIFATSAVLSVAIFANALNAEQIAEAKIENIVVTGAGYAQDIKETPASVSVVTAEEIASKPVRNLGDIVEEIPGVTTTTEKTGTKGIQIRGFSKAYTLLLVDGKKINMDSGFDGNGFDATGGFIPPVSMIERVEVVKGPAGGKYGSEAIGGVVNVITKTPTQTMASIMLESTLQENKRWGNMYGVNGFVAHPFNENVSMILRTKYQVGEQNKLTHDIVPGYKPRNSYNPYFAHAAGAYQNWGVGGRINLKLDEQNKFYIDHDYNYQRLGTLNTSGQSITAVREYHRNTTVLNHDGEYSWGNLNNYIQYINTRRYPHDTSKGDFKSKIGNSKGKPIKENLTENQIITAGSTWTKNFELSNTSSMILNFGPYFSWEKLYNRTDRDKKTATGESVTPKDAWQAAVFGESEIFWNEYISTTFGLRANFVETYGNFYNPRAYINFYATEWLTFKAGIANGLKVPTLAQRLDSGLYDSTSGKSGTTMQYGNSDLVPEKSWNYEIGAMINGEYGFASATIFYTQFKDKIENMSYDDGDTLPFNYGVCAAGVDGTCAVYENVAKADLKGFELETRIKPILKDYIPGGLSFDFSYGYNKTEQKSGVNKGMPLNTIPEQKFTAKMTHKLGEYSSFIRYVGNYKINTSTNKNSTSAVGEYYNDTNIVDIGVNYHFKKSGITLGAMVNNLLDENFEDYMLTSPTSVSNRYQKAVAGRNYWLTLKADF